MRRDPYHDEKIYHFAAKINANGDVSALCYKVPRAINLKITLWTNRPEAVTCQKCKRALAARAR
jgi:hypothetical protein